MRISDWSSDVCSSDLIIAWLPARRTRRESGAFRQNIITVRGVDTTEMQLVPALHRIGEVPDRRAGHGGLLPRRGEDAVETGRAACRDRGCQYGQSSSVPVSLKKRRKQR